VASNPLCTEVETQKPRLALYERGPSLM